MKIRAVIFDMDGTIVDVSYDWQQIKKELNTGGKPILHYLISLKEPERSEKWKALEKFEDEATAKASLKEGMKEFLDFLAEKGVKRALVTNNSNKNVNFLLRKFNLQFEVILSRESGLWKPSGSPFEAVLKKLSLKKEEVCVVGDSHFDIEAAQKAGISIVFILNKNKERFDHFSVEVFSSVKNLKERIGRLI